MRLIDADALIDDAMDMYCKDCDKRKGIKDGKYRIIYEIGEAPCGACDVDDMLCELEDAPTVDPVKHGHWIAHDMSIKDVPTEACSECGEWSYGYNEPYCQKCGAKMDEVAE